MLLTAVCVSLWTVPDLLTRAEDTASGILMKIPGVSSFLSGGADDGSSEDAMVRIQHLLGQQKAMQDIEPPKETEEPLVLIGGENMSPEERERLLREAEANRPSLKRRSKMGVPPTPREVVEGDKKTG